MGLEKIWWTRTEDEFINFVGNQTSHNTFYGNKQKRISKTYSTNTRSYKFLAEEDTGSWKLIQSFFRWAVYWSHHKSRM